MHTRRGLLSARSRMGMARPAATSLLAAALLLGACSDGSDPDVPETTASDPSGDETDGEVDGDDRGEAPDDNEAAPEPVTLPDAVPDTPAGEQLAWILTSIHPDGEPPTPGQIADRLAPPLNGMITPSQLLRSFDELRADGPWDLRNEPATRAQLTAELYSESADRTVLINLSVGDEGRMVGLFVAGDE